MNTAKIITLIEKTHYPFKSYPRTGCETILFPGCSFPSQFPRTMDRLSELCRAAGFGIIYDCCGDPLEGFGKEGAARRVLRNLDRKLKDLGCKRLVLVCPTCRKHLTGELGCEVVTIYDVIDELGIDLPGSFGAGSLHVPCPDKKSRDLESRIRDLIDMGQVETITKAGCCGLRADLASRGPEFVKKLSSLIIESADGGMLYTYCASCLGQFSRMGYNDCRHVVSVLLGVDEEPDSARALLNRAKRKFDRNTNPLTGSLKKRHAVIQSVSEGSPRSGLPRSPLRGDSSPSAQNDKLAYLDNLPRRWLHGERFVDSLWGKGGLPWIG